MIEGYKTKDIKAEKTKATVEGDKTQEAKVGGVSEGQISSIYNVLSQELIRKITKPNGMW